MSPVFTDIRHVSTYKMSQGKTFFEYGQLIRKEPAICDETADSDLFEREAQGAC